MTREEKLTFINSIPFKLAMISHRGCDPDWFTRTYDKYKDYKPKKMVILNILKYQMMEHLGM